MKKNEIELMAYVISSKARMTNKAIQQGLKEGNIFEHQLDGMLEILKFFKIKYEFVWDYTQEYMTGFKIPEYNIDIII